MSDLEKAARMALEALENWREFDPENWGDTDNKAVTALRQALSNSVEQPAQQSAERGEPVGQLMEEAYGRGQVLWFKKPHDLSMLYTSPPASKPWVGLTDDDLDDIATAAKRGNLHDLRLAIEAKLKEKNNGTR